MCVCICIKHCFVRKKTVENAKNGTNSNNSNNNNSKRKKRGRKQWTRVDWCQIPTMAALTINNKLKRIKNKKSAFCNGNNNKQAQQNEMKRKQKITSKKERAKRKKQKCKGKKKFGFNNNNNKNTKNNNDRQINRLTNNDNNKKRDNSNKRMISNEEEWYFVGYNYLNSFIGEYLSLDIELSILSNWQECLDLECLDLDWCFVIFLLFGIVPNKCTNYFKSYFHTKLLSAIEKSKLLR